MNRTIIIVAYACSPEGLSEKWLGWKWAEAASRTGKVILITRPNRSGLKEACDTSGIELLEVKVPALIRLGTQGLGDFGMWLRVNAWAAQVRKTVRALDASRGVSYGHLVTFHSVQMPSVFDGCTFTKVWGPVSGMEYIPQSYIRHMGPDRLKETLRNFLLKATTKSIQEKSLGYDVILYGNTQTMNAVEKRRAGVSRLVMPNNIDANSGNFPQRNWKPGNELRLLFVGSCQARRAIPLVLHALAKSSHLYWTIDIAGTGSGLEQWKALAETLSIKDRVKFHGWVGKEKVDQLFDRSHLFVFPSLRDGGSSGMLEAIERGMPVLALDWGGPADVIGNSGAGHLFPVSSPEETIHAFRSWFDDLFQGRILYSDLISAVNAYDIRIFGWDYKMSSLSSAIEEAKIKHLGFV